MQQVATQNRSVPAPNSLFTGALDGLPDDRILVETELVPRRIIPDFRIPLALFDSTDHDRLTIRLADHDGHRNQASYLVRKMYGWRGYHVAPCTTPTHRITLVASHRGNTLATISVGLDSHDGLAVESLYPEHVDEFRGKDARLCEFTRLAVDKTEHSKELLAMVFHVAYIYARRMHRSTDLLIEVNPRHVAFYRRMLGFVPVGPERVCQRVGAPAVLLWLSLDHAEEQIARFGGRAEATSETRSLYPLFFSSAEERGITRRLQAIG